MGARRGKIEMALLALAALVFLGATIYELVLAITGSDFVDLADNFVVLLGQPNPKVIDSQHDALPWILASLIAGTLGLLGWWRARAGAAGAIARERAAREEAERQADQARADQESEQQRAQELEAEREQLSSQVSERDEKLSEERQRRSQVERARQAEKDWNHELRDQLRHLHSKSGMLGDMSDMRTAMLQIAMTLLQAEKGMLLSRKDSDGDGHLDLVAAENFDHDPHDSAVAQRFAGEVLERDTTVREDESAVDAEKRTAADEEIKNLVAIPIYIQDDFSGVIVCANKDGGFHEHDDEVLLAIGDHAGAVLENSRLHGDLRSAYLATVRMLAEAIEVKDPLLRGHSEAVSGYVATVADRLGVEPQRREELIFGSLLHDVGKIGISERILLKPGALTPEERSVIQLHPRIGYRLVQQVPALRAIAPAVLHHHERFDGDGYPAGLRAEEIPLEARIVCVADCFSAMTVARPYKEPISVEDACAELERCAGSQFDPEVVRLFVEEVRRRPPDEVTSELLGEAPDDPELELRRENDENVFGSRSFGVTDSLTLLYSHRHFHEVVAAEAHRSELQGQPFGVVLVQLTNLGEVNRQDGYAAGDAAIQTAARTVQELASARHGVAARYSGRRLGLIAPGADEAEIQRLATAINEALTEGPEIRVGFAAWQSGEAGDDVVARAMFGQDAAGATATA